MTAQYTEVPFDGRTERFLTDDLTLAQLYLSGGTSARAVAQIFEDDGYPHFVAMRLVIAASRLQSATKDTEGRP